MQAIDVPGLTLPRPQGLTISRQFVPTVPLSQAFTSGNFFIECRNYLIDPLIGALGRQTHAH